MNEQCAKCRYREQIFCIIKNSQENGRYFRIDNATEKCNYYIEVERED